MTKPAPKSIISMDVGHKRVGLAGCDPLGITVSRLPAIHRKCFDEDIKIIKRLCDSRRAKGLVIGLPLSEDGSPTKQTEYCKKYGQRMAKALLLPMAWVNEHSSSWEAANMYNLKHDRSGQLDSAVAVLLLEQWLREGPELKPVQMSSYPIRQMN